MSAQSTDRAGEMRALFARVSQNARVVVPINNAAADPRCDAPAFYCVHSLSGAGGTDFIALANRVGCRGAHLWPSSAAQASGWP